jgi:hypothetical protein
MRLARETPAGKVLARSVCLMYAVLTKDMKDLFTRFRLIGVFALVVLAAGCAQTGQTENQLSSAGFTTIVAATAQQQQHLKTLPPYKVTVSHRNGKIYYVYADPAHNQIYVGTQFQYDRYRDIRLVNNLTQQNAQAVDLSTDEDLGWDQWGPWAFQDH